MGKGGKVQNPCEHGHGKSESMARDEVIVTTKDHRPQQEANRSTEVTALRNISVQIPGRVADSVICPDDDVQAAEDDRRG